MKNKIAAKITSLMLTALILTGIIFVPVNFQAAAKTEISQLEDVIDNILAWKYDGDVQALLDDVVSNEMGGSIGDWYVISLGRYKYKPDFSACLKSLDSYTASTNNLKATDRQRISIVYTSVGSNNDFVRNTIKDSVGKLGIMSYIYGLIMLDCGAYQSDNISRDDIIDHLLSLQTKDGGWALTGTAADVDITAIALQALARYDKYDKVKNAINKALTCLSKKQLDDGDFQSYGTPNSESTAQVMVALNTLNIDYCTDSRFVKNGNTVFDGIMKYQKTDGGFSHTHGGTSNQLATVQVLYALISLWRYESDMSPLFEFVDNNTDLKQEEQTSETSKPEIDIPPQTSGEESRTSDVTSRMEQSSFVSSTVSADTQISNQASSDFPELSKESSVTETAEPEESLESEEENIVTNTSDISESSKNSFDNSETVSETSREESIKTSGETATKTNYNFIVCISIAGVFGIVLVVMIIRKKANKKNILIWALCFAVLIVFALSINIQAPDDYYNQSGESTDMNSKTVTLSISCTRAVGQTDNKYIPQNGVILTAEYTLNDGDTVFDVLLKASKENKIQLDYTGSQDLIYIKGINYLYEFDCGDLSGWTYKVNDTVPNVGCSGYVLNDGDVIEWVYTLDVGKDIE